MTAQTLPDDPNYAFCPSYDLGDEPQQIRIVFEGVDGYVPTALVALTVICCGGRYVAVVQTFLFLQGLGPNHRNIFS